MTSTLTPNETAAAVERLYALDQDLIDNPFPVYARMRRDTPVIRTGPLVSVSRYDAVRAVLRDATTFSSIRHQGSRVAARRAQLTEEQAVKFDALVGSEGLWLTETDEPFHGRLRRFVNTTFSAKRIAAMREEIEQITRQLLDEVETRGDRRFDLIGDFAYKMPLRVICRLLGASGPETEMIRVWSDAIGTGIGTEYSNIDEAFEALQNFKEYVTGLIARSRSAATQDDTDLFSELVAPDSDGQVLSDDDLVAMFIQLLFAGHETTTNLIANAIIALHENPEQKRMLQDDPSSIRPAVDEFLRYCGSIHAVHRVATIDCDIAGFAVKAGETVRVLIAAANHDESVFDDPDTLDVTRTNARQHVGLGFGIHTCLGQWLTRLEGEVALSELLSRYPDLAPDGAYSMQRNFTLHGPAQLQVRY